MKTNDMPVLILEGSPRERGRTHGETLKTKIHEHIFRMKAFVEKGTKKDPNKLLNEFMTQTDFIPAIRKWTPELLDELEGVAEGAGEEFNSVFALNLADEIWWYIEQKNGKLTDTAFWAENCSGIGVSAMNGMPTLVAQNLDMPAYYDGLQVLLRFKESKNSLETIAFSFAGVLGTVGVNSHSLAMCENTLLPLRHADDGLPVIFVSRGVIDQPTLEDAVTFLNRIKHASGQNYIIGSAVEVMDYECSSQKVIRYFPVNEESLICHTNHPLINDDRYVAEKKAENSIARFDSVTKSLSQAQIPITSEDIKEALSSHSSEPHAVCVHPSKDKDVITANCIIYELSQVRKVHYTAGPPCSTDFTTLVF